ncbi:MAG TPA: peptidoglycan DD-metalloendopeptidase family protein [Polyangiaceae bacterium]|nr:peptidoglycan DD-metalloendopeptidase family protein [Polyangiaceae bacterium]
MAPISTAFRRPATAVVGALAAVAVLSAGAGSSRGPTARAAATDRDVPLVAAGSLAPSPCPARTLPDGDACVRLPDDGDGAPEAESAPNGHHDKRGHWTTYDEIPRRPDRPADYDAYRYPVPCDHRCVVSGFDLDRPDDVQRRGPRLRQVGHGAVDLPQKKGTPIRMLALEHQQGDAEVVYVGPLFGTTVVTRHTLREAGQLHDYLLIFGHLDAQAPGVRTGVHLKDGDLVGFVGDTASPDLVHLHLEARRMRAGVDAAKLPPSVAIANESSVVCDPRNVLPLR